MMALNLLKSKAWPKSKSKVFIRPPLTPPKTKLTLSKAEMEAMSIFVIAGIVSKDGAFCRKTTQEDAIRPLEDFSSVSKKTLKALEKKELILTIPGEVMCLECSVAVDCYDVRHGKTPEYFYLQDISPAVFR